ncbi:MAG: hypothetical protein JWP89_5384 [Schlesneria sp.]|nr:hypothetical protein [Schlesneria sp.]
MGLIPGPKGPGWIKFRPLGPENNEPTNDLQIAQGQEVSMLPGRVFDRRHGTQIRARATSIGHCHLAFVSSIQPS